MKFKDLPVGQLFECNGNLAVKCSTRTARLIQYDRVFYYQQDTEVTPKTTKENDDEHI